jgi:hypothetical protein
MKRQVNSFDPAISSVEPLALTSSISTPSLPSSYTTMPASSSHHGSQNMHRPSLAVLQTRVAMPVDYDSSYEASPADPVPFAPSFHRHDSLNGAYSVENYRSWNTTAGPMAAPTSTALYEPHCPFTWGSMSGPSAPYTTFERLPSVTSESMSSLSMGTIEPALPCHSHVYDRRLPIPLLPPEQSRTTLGSGKPVDIRPLDLPSNHRVHGSGIHGENTLPWVINTTTDPSPMAPMSTYAPPSGLPTVGGMTDPSHGYHFSAMPPAESSSSDGSHSSGPALSEPYSTTYDFPAPMDQPMYASYPKSTASEAPVSSASEQIMPPRWYPTPSNTISSGYGDNGIHNGYNHSRRAERESNRVSGPFSTPLAMRQRSKNKQRDSQINDENISTSYNSSKMQHPRPQHAANIEGLYRQSSDSPRQSQSQSRSRRASDEHRERRKPSSSAASRISISNLHAPY